LDRGLDVKRSWIGDNDHAGSLAQGAIQLAKDTIGLEILGNGKRPFSAPISINAGHL
jgi:hypothetical protein